MASAVSADLSSLAADLQYASTMGIQKAAEQLIQQGAQEIQKQAQANAPVKTGRLQRSITIRYTSPLSAIIGPDTPYAVYQEFGTGSRGEFPTTPYVIRPHKAGGVLVFTVGGKKVFARVVNHPGIPARPFMRPAFEQVFGASVVKELADKGALLITKGPNA